MSTDYPFKVGDRVELIEEYCDLPKGYQFTVGGVYSSVLAVNQGMVTGGECGAVFGRRLKLVEENNMDNLQAGDVIVRDEQEYGIIGVFGQMVLSVDITRASGRDSVDVDTIPGLKSNGWRVKGEEPEVKELTIAEIAERLNIPVDQLRIKD